VIEMTKSRIDLARQFAGGVLCLMLSAAPGCGDDDSGSGGVSNLAKIGDVPAVSAAGEALEITVDVTGADGMGQIDVEVSFRVELGGGGIEPATARTDAAGRASAFWTIGVAPVTNRLSVSARESSLEYETRARLDRPLRPEAFGDIPSFIAEQMLAGSTEDLAFDEDRRLLVGFNGGPIVMDADGNSSLLPISGDAIEAPLGLAFDAAGNLWVADSRDGPALPRAGALLRVSPDGVVTTELTTDGEEDLIGPNYVAIGADEKIYLSDPCLGKVVRYDPLTGEVDAIVRFDVGSEGGPNGFAFDAAQERLYIATESIALLCSRPDVDATLVDPVAGLYAVDVRAEGFGTVEPLAERMGLFGDGVAFDAEGNLYVIFDTQVDLALEESAVWVLPAGDIELYKFLSAGDVVFANLAFGRGAFGEETMYIALLAIDAFNLPVRGVNRIEIGIAGLPLPW
jgi:sugar lactone lactonase YvrE